MLTADRFYLNSSSNFKLNSLVGSSYLQREVKNELETFTDTQGRPRQDYSWATMKQELMEIWQG